MQVHTVLVALQRSGVVDNAIYRGDMIFENDEPVLVLEWAGERGASAPAVSVPLHRTCLSRAEHESAEYLHADPVEDPRR